MPRTMNYFLKMLTFLPSLETIFNIASEFLNIYAAFDKDVRQDNHCIIMWVLGLKNWKRNNISPQ